MDIHHETLVFEREFDAAPARLFKAFTDPRARETWSAPSPEAKVVIDETDVRTGGRETARCGSADDLKWTLRTAYHRVTEDRQITFTEELWDGDQLLTVALITFDFQPSGPTGAKLTLTDQITSFVGAGPVAGHQEGYQMAIKNLAAYVTGM